MITPVKSRVDRDPFCKRIKLWNKELKIYLAEAGF